MRWLPFVVVAVATASFAVLLLPSPVSCAEPEVAPPSGNRTLLFVLVGALIFFLTLVAIILATFYALGYFNTPTPLEVEEEEGAGTSRGGRSKRT